MKIILAAPRGFCAGVNMAVNSLERALQMYGAPVFVYHDIVHNTCHRFLPTVVEDPDRPLASRRHAKGHSA